MKCIKVYVNIDLLQALSISQELCLHIDSYFKNRMSVSGVMHVERSSYKFRPYRGVTAAGRFFCIQHLMVPKPLFYIYSDSADHRKSTKFESIKSKWLAQQFAGSFNHITGLLKYNLTQIGISNPIYI